MPDVKLYIFPRKGFALLKYSQFVIQDPETIMKNMYLLQYTGIIAFYNLYMETRLGSLNPDYKIMLSDTSLPQ